MNRARDASPGHRFGRRTETAAFLRPSRPLPRRLLGVWAQDDAVMAERAADRPGGEPPATAATEVAALAAVLVVRRTGNVAHGIALAFPVLWSVAAITT